MINPGLMAYNVLEQRAKAVGGPNAFCICSTDKGLRRVFLLGKRLAVLGIFSLD